MSRKQGRSEEAGTSRKRPIGPSDLLGVKEQNLFYGVDLARLIEFLKRFFSVK